MGAQSGAGGTPLPEGNKPGARIGDRSKPNECLDKLATARGEGTAVKPQYGRYLSGEERTLGERGRGKGNIVGMVQNKEQAAWVHT